MWEFTSPRKIVFGEEALEYLKEIEGRRALIITGKTVRKLGFADKVSKYLEEAGMQIKIFDEVEPEPSIETIAKGAKLAREYAPDWLIGLGGGSNMDAAKAIWVLYERPDMEVGAISPVEKLGLRKKAHLICIPTTSGSGSEATWATIITDSAGRTKLELASKELVPDIVILDPQLPKHMPSKLTGETGMDALVHSMEAYVNQWRNDFSNAMAIEAIKIIFEYLPRVYSNPDDIEAREKMQIAATMSGLAFGNAQAGIAHSMGHALGAIFKISHGRTVGMLLPYTIKYNGKNAIELYVEIAKAIRIQAITNEEYIEKLVQAVKDLMKKVNIPFSIQDIGLDWSTFENELDELVRRAIVSSETITNPRVPDEEECKMLFVYAFNNKEIDF
ncbi:MAG: iron-containing alcohol dehydrogenase [Nitrososphaeria archaeon]|nr:iron-containing alcohol dehydrogenase [Nitrososphaeria archaeon]